MSEKKIRKYLTLQSTTYSIKDCKKRLEKVEQDFDPEKRAKVLEAINCLISAQVLLLEVSMTNCECSDSEIEEASNDS